MDLHGEEDQQEDADYQRLGTPEAQDDGFERDEVLRKPDGPHITTQASVVSTFCDFLTVAIHTILYERNIYSPELFLSTRVYNHPVRQIRHPRLCKWIQDAVDACESQISEV